MQDTFEVQTLKDGRWMIEQRCRNEEEAIAEAHELNNTRAFRSVKVIKEVYDPSAKLYRETVVLQLQGGAGNTLVNGGSNGSSRPTVQRASGGAQGGNGPRAKAAGPKRKRSILDFFRD